MGERHRATDRPLGQTSPETVELQLKLRPVPRASPEARQALAVFGESLPAETYSDLKLIVSELVTNGVKYGPGDSIHVLVALEPSGRVRGDVDDGGAGGVRMRSRSDLATGGLGLLIVDALTSSWGVHPGSSQVWFELGGEAV